MSRGTERTVLGVLGFVGALLGLFVGISLLTGGSAVDVASSPGGGEGATDPAAPDGETDSEVGGEADSLVVSTTAGLVTTTAPSTTASVVSTTTSSTMTSVESSTSTSAAIASSTTDSDSTTTASTATVVETTVSDDDDVSDTTPSSTSTSSTATSLPPSTTEVRSDLTDIEREIIRLTNELRTDPAGPQRRQGPMPECVADSKIDIDPETGHPIPVRRLTPSQPVSVRMARDWSRQMADADVMSHRSGSSQDEIYAELGVDWAARGENVAWAVGYDLPEVAQLFFRGWRESDGHYCNMMSGAFTEIGVGHVRTDGGKDFATQNFYRPR